LRSETSGNQALKLILLSGEAAGDVAKAFHFETLERE
jgi:hypothetical protein